MECEIIGGEATPGLETSEVNFFNIESLPELSERRVTKGQILQMYELAQSKNKEPVFD